MEKFYVVAVVTFADKLRRWRGSRPVKEAAFILGIPYSTYKAYESGSRLPHPNCCGCCLEKKMLLTAPVVIPAPRPLPAPFL
jgi:hypothetical protein